MVWCGVRWGCWGGAEQCKQGEAVRRGGVEARQPLNSSLNLHLSSIPGSTHETDLGPAQSFLCLQNFGICLETGSGISTGFEYSSACRQGHDEIWIHFHWVFPHVDSPTVLSLISPVPSAEPHLGQTKDLPQDSTSFSHCPRIDLHLNLPLNHSGITPGSGSGYSTGSTPGSTTGTTPKYTPGYTAESTPQIFPYTHP